MADASLEVGEAAGGADAEPQNTADLTAFVRVLCCFDVALTLLLLLHLGFLCFVVCVSFLLFLLGFCTFLCFFFVVVFVLFFVDFW